MRYSMIAAALLGLAVAAPYAGDDHHDEPKKDDWAPAPAPAPEPKKDDWTPAPPKPEPKKDDWKPAPVKPEEPKKDDWKPAPAPTQKPDWKPAPVEEKKCSYTKVYTTKECGADKDKWDNCKDVVKTTTEYPEKCTWGEAPAPKETWAPAPVKPEEKKCSYTTVYVTKECGADKDKWDNCKDVTKTSTVYPEKCTWGEAKAPEAKTTWAEVPAKTPEAAATWAPAPVKPAAAASSTVWAPVAKWTGAADKQSFGVGAIAIAAVAALL